MGDSRLVRASAVVVLGLLALGCGSKESGPRKVTRSPAEPWAVSTTDPTAATPAWLSNGLIGLRIGRDGTGTGNTAYLTDEYDTDGEQKIIPLQNPFAITIRVDDVAVTPIGSSGYEQRLEFKTGALVTRWTTDRGVRVETKTFVDPDRRVAAQHWSVRAPRVSRIAVHAPRLRLDRPTDKETRVLSSIVNLTDGRQLSGTGAGFEVDFAATDAINFRRTVLWPLGSASKTIADVQREPLPVVDLTRMPDVSLVEGRAKQFWGSGTAPDIEIDGPVEDQQAIRSFLFAIRSAVNPQGTMGVAPMALSSSIYNGHVFWDADLWVFPALLLLDPERAATISRYRLNLRMAAVANAKVEVMRVGLVRPPDSDFLQFPWQSSVTGIDVATPLKNRAQIHVTGSVVFALQKAAAFGLVDSATVNEVGVLAANFYLDWASPTSTPGVVALKHVMSPDEFAEDVNNDLYTNVVAQWCVDRYRPGARVRFHLPRTAAGFATYDGDEEKVYKQAAAVLAIYPLQYPPAEAEAASMLDRFASKITPNGPAMADAVHALIWARIGQPDRALDVWRRSWMQYTNHPLMLFSEKKSRDATVFVTGAGGCLQTVLYGFLGLRIDRNKPVDAAWMMPLRDGYWLSARPNLPKEWRSVTLKNFTVLGKRMTLTVAGKRVQVTQGVP